MTSQLAADDISVTFPGIQLVDVPAHDVTAYSQGFETSIDGFTGTNTTPSRITGLAHSGVGSMVIDSPTSNVAGVVSRTITGLTVGASYTLSVWGDGFSATGRVSIGVTGIGASTPVAPNPVRTWQQYTYAFTATATSHVIHLDYTVTGTGQVFVWDDVLLVRHVPATYKPFEADVKGYRITLDETRAPYVEADITISTPDQATAEAIDPTDNMRVVVTLTKVWTAPVRDPQTMTLDLYLHARTNNAVAGETSVALHSDEAVLIDDMGLTVDHSLESQTDLRTLVGAVLALYGWTLAAGTATADIRRTANATNLFRDPGTAFSAGGGYSVTSASIDGNDTSWSISGDGDSINLFSPTAADSFMFADSSVTGAIPYGMRAGGVYTFSASGNVKVALSGTWDSTHPTDPRTARLVVIQRGAPGTDHIIAVSPAVPNVINTPTRVSITFALPSDTTWVQFRWYLGATAGQIRWDGFRLSETAGIDDTSYFDGDVNLDPTHYAVGWDGTPDASTSHRTRLDNRSPDALTRTPGTKTWDFISPMIQAAGLRLFCDEARVWRLVPNGYVIDGQVHLAQAVNLVEGSDTIDLSAADNGGSTPAYYVKVAIKYAWIDSATGLSQEVYDTAGSGVGPGLYLEVNAPYPGPGAAAAALVRGQGRKRVLDMTGLTDLTARPGMGIAATLPIIPGQLGVISSVSFSDQDEMQIGMRAGIDAPPNAWAFAVGPWSAATGSWSAATGTN